MTIGQIADSTGLNVQSIRFYERKGLLPDVSRTAAGYRQFDMDAIRRIQFIKHAQVVGFSLREISDLLSLQIDPNGSCQTVKRYASEKIEQLDERLSSLKKMRNALVNMMEMCDDGLPARSCPILDALDNDNHVQISSE